jgi:lipopolysaccharide transport system ATP-binding protein
LNENVLEVRNVSKKYCKTIKKSMLYGINDILKNTFGLKTNSGTLRIDEFWAIDNISFDLKKGEILGIVGPNGSGKTTLLKMINGIFWPDKGKIMVRGKVGALIAVGAGFHPMLSGRENIYLNAAILGMQKKEIEQKIDEIISFADLGDFIEVPVKFYSSGMYVRLGFSVAVHCEPEVLLIDEVLAVGDMRFRAKCYKKIAEISQKSTVVLISHSLEIISRICDRAIFLLKGKIVFDGPTEKTLGAYTKYMGSTEKRSFFTSSSIKKVSITNVEEGDKSLIIEQGDNLEIIIKIDHSNMTAHKIVFRLNVLDADSKSVIFKETREKKIGQIILNGEKSIIEIIMKNLRLAYGTYTFGITLFDTDGQEILFNHANLGQIIVTDDKDKNSFQLGVYSPKIEIKNADEQITENNNINRTR